MTFLSDKDFYLEVAKGNVSGHTIVHVSGQNISVGTTFVPVSKGGLYITPQVAGATTLRIKAGGNANDTVAGSGAREVTFFGIDETGALASEAVNTAGASASSVTTTTFMRMFHAEVTKSGTYATMSTGSHAANIVIENGAGGTDWATIEGSDYPRSHAAIGAYTIPTAHKGHLLSGFGFVDAAKTTDLIFFKRTGILAAAAPYDAMEIIFEERSGGGEFTLDIKAPVFLGAECDCGFMAKIDSTTAEVQVDFEIMLIQD